jgi:HAD superfamily hydrolase (TIGR01509 family)
MNELAAALGGRGISDEARSRTVGTSMPVAMAVLYADLGITRTEAEMHADGRWVTDRTAQLLAGDIEWRPGAAELLTAVRDAGLATALVTTTPRRLAEIVLGSIRRDLGGDPFHVTVCGDEVSARKPDPAPYRHAMDALGVEPGECVVIEDSLAGISAGLAAGVAVLGVPAEQVVPPTPGLTVMADLTGIGVPFLDQLIQPRDLVSADA